jgi:flagella basal body P-ring formation protein FlgA
MEPVNARVNGQVREMIDVPVAAASLPAGTILGSDDLHMGRVGSQAAHGEVVHTLEQAIGLQLTHAIAAGQPLAPGDLTRPVMVRRGALVQLRLTTNGLSVTGRGVALESGAEGERVKVRNPGSKTELIGVVIGPDLVRVTPDARAGAVVNRGSTVFSE